MRIVLQRVKSASVSIEGTVVGEIEQGFLLLVGVGPDDTRDDASYLARKIAGMRIFSDENGKMNLSIDQVGGKILSVSQFTLFADTKKETDLLLQELPVLKLQTCSTKNSMKSCARSMG